MPEIPHAKERRLWAVICSYPYWSYPRCVINHTLLLCILMFEDKHSGHLQSCTPTLPGLNCALHSNGLRRTSPSISLENICHNRFFQRERGRVIVVARYCDEKGISGRMCVHKYTLWYLETLLCPSLVTFYSLPDPNKELSQLYHVSAISSRVILDPCVDSLEEIFCRLVLF